MKENHIVYEQYIAEMISKNLNYSDYVSSQTYLPSSGIAYMEYLKDNERKKLYEKRNRVIKKLLNENE